MNKSNNLISSRQTVFLILTSILATVDVFLPAEVARYAGRDAWMSAILATFIGYFIYRVIVALCLLFPDYSLAGFNRLLLGKYLGGVLTVFYIIAMLTVSTGVTVQFAVIMGTAFKPESSPYIWHLMVLIPALYVTSLGIHVPARMNELLLPFGLIVLLGVMVLNIPEMDFKEYLPMFYHGYLPPVKGALVIGAKLAYSVMILALIPFIEKKKKLPRQGLPAFICVGLALLAGTTAIALMGPKLTAMTLFPALEMVRHIDIGFLTRLDVIMMAVWHTGFFIFLCVSIYFAASLTRELFNLRGYKLILWIYGLVIFIGANIYITSVPLIRFLLVIPLAVLLYTVGLVIPLFLYLIARFRGYSKKKAT
ncbi:spore germination protein [Desulfotomaculum nigrificans CO-1-SRB]|uniref:Spore germination protein n=1 Tax=Desulfotomaculum nigrificans (strain DSM 14880 / VKM B-2319 / CO-1-SRB) TaxID=868595 RepID=F6B8K9_DESCC|nr:endospore germination permease [Desulfotomaculum nigrificans]AEF93581.1 spore germination protein [Desulfotomaculum nigrificans CO-1-SRB]